MLKLKLLGTVLFLVVLKAAAQYTPPHSPKALLLAIQKSKPDTNRISLQLKLGSYYFFREGQFKSGLDSARTFLNRATQLSNKLHEVDWQYLTLAKMGNYYAEAGQIDSCRQCFMRVIAHYHQTGNFYKEAGAWEWLGDMYDSGYINQNYRERLNCYQHARSVYLQNHHPIEAADILSGIANDQIAHKQFDLAENELQQVLTQYKTTGNKKLQYIYNALANLEYDKGNYYRVTAYCLQGIKSMGASKDTISLANFYSTAAGCYFVVKKYKEALEWIRKAIAFKTNNIEYRCTLVQTLIALNNITEAYVALNELSKKRAGLIDWDTLNIYRTFALYYDKVNNNNLALQYHLKALKIANKLQDYEEMYNKWQVMCNNEIAAVYLKTNQAAKAKKYLHSAAIIFKKSKTAIDLELSIDFYDHLYKYDAATGNYPAAIKDLEHRLKLQDSVFTTDKDKQLAELNIQYETTQNEQSIKALHSQAIVQQVSLGKANLQKNITIGGIMAMIMVSGLFYRNYKLKQKANNIITHKNELLQHLLTEKEWLLKEIHHRVKNNLHTVICLLESQAQYLENNALKAVENSQHRIYAMSLIHQKLYQSDDIKTIDMGIYIPELVRALEDGFGVSNQIQFRLKVDPVSLDISRAIPLGLIINEVVTNSIKYAFPGNMKGEISILMLEVADLVKLEMADNGIGMPYIDQESESKSLGFRLIKGLGEDIDAQIIFEVDNGTKITIFFKRPDLNDMRGSLKSAGAKEGIYA